MCNKADFLTNDKFLALASANIAYIKTDVIWNGRPIQWRGHPHNLRSAPVWITGHSDCAVTKELYDRYSSHSMIWYTVNKECRVPNLHSIPLGITNDCDDTPVHRIFGNTDIMIQVMNEPRSIKNLVYMNFVINTYPRERRSVSDLFRDKTWVTTEESIPTMEGRRTFLQSIRNHKFVLCPRGNGADTHRLWETLYMGSIPIVKRHVAMEDFYDLPITWIDDWTEVTETFLAAEYDRITTKEWNLEKLKFSYWKDRIIGGSV